MQIAANYILFQLQFILFHIKYFPLRKEAYLRLIFKNGIFALKSITQLKGNNFSISASRELGKTKLKYT